MNKLIASVFLFWAFLFSAASAQSEFPQYDGVYIFDYENNRWTELSRKRLFRTGIIASPGDDGNVVSLFPAVPQAYGRTSVVHGVLINEIDRAPKLKDGRLKIFVRSPDMKLNFVEIAVHLGDLQGTINKRPQPKNVMSNSGPDMAGQLKPFSGEPLPHLVMVRLGWNPNDHFRVRTIDQFSSVYELKSQIVEGKSVRGYSSTNCRVNCMAPAAAYFIHLVNPMRSRSSGYDLPGNHYLFTVKAAPPPKSETSGIPRPWDKPFFSREKLRCYNPETGELFTWEIGEAKSGCAVGTYRIREPDARALE